MRITMKMTFDVLLRALRLKAHAVADGKTNRAGLKARNGQSAGTSNRGGAAHG
ncbi:MAG: hypothetical protein KDJ74_14785 [Notoacmeibacter sp.]|nr:hypothetical protein [Notoacmeibacter sp.]